MKFTQTQQLLIALVIFAISGYIIYSSFFAPAKGAIVSSDISSSTAQTEGQDIIDLANQLNSVSIDKTFFASPLFLSLKDYDVPFTAGSQGRSNPFDTIGNGNNNSQGFLSVGTTTKK